MYVVLSCQGVRVVGGVRTFFRIFVFSTCPYSERQKFCNHFFKTYPYTRTSRTVVLFPSLTKGRRKYSWHYCTFCTIDQVRKCKSAKCKRYGVLHYWGWAGFNSSNSFFPFVLCWYLLFKCEKNLCRQIEMFGFLPNQWARIKMKVWCVLIRFVHSKCQIGEMTTLKNVKVLSSN